MYRLQIWHWIGYNLRDAWLFGTGGKDWARPAQMIASVDSLWLVQSLRSGYVGLGLLVACIASPFFVWTPRDLPRYPTRDYGRLQIAVAISILQLVFLAFAVHIWGIMWACLAMLLGIRAGLSEARFLPPDMRGDDDPDPRAVGDGPLGPSAAVRGRRRARIAGERGAVAAAAGGAAG
jgi:hypothetical protein